MEFLVFVSFIGLIKYGLWTALVLVMFWPSFYAADPLIYSLNLPLHIGMIAEGVVLYAALKPRKIDVAAAALFFVVNDILDYFIVGSIPIVGDVLDGITWGAISAWVLFRGIDRPQSSLFAGAIELIPFGDLLPTYTLMVAGIVIYNNRAHA